MKLSLLVCSLPVALSDLFNFHPPPPSPTDPPSGLPTTMPSTEPSFSPSSPPSMRPSTQPTLQPSTMPPSLSPSATPSTSPPTESPSVAPSTLPPTFSPVVGPSSLPPTRFPSLSPSVLPTQVPTAQPSTRPSEVPSLKPSTQPSLKPSLQPTTAMPSTEPSVAPPPPVAQPPTKHPPPLCPVEDACTEDGFLVTLFNTLFGTTKYSTRRLERDGTCVDRCEVGTLEMNNGWECGSCDGQVRPDDVKLVPPAGGKPTVAAIVGYNWRRGLSWPDEQFELPIYEVLDRAEPEFWNYMLDELLYARLDVYMFHGRGCLDKEAGTELSMRGIGNMCPRQLKYFVDAVERAGVSDVVKMGMWDDTGSYRTARNRILGTNDPQFDVGDESNWQFFWDYNIKIWFDTVPAHLWYRIHGKPVIANWNLRNDEFMNQQGNASRLLDWLKMKFMARFSVEPLFIVEDSWFRLDTTMTSAQAFGRHRWFNPAMNRMHTYTEYNGREWGIVVAGFRDPRTIPGCGASCREVMREGGKVFTDGMDAGVDADFILIEAMNNMVESGGYYRSEDWAYPTQYLNLMRRYTDPEPETLQFQAEGADTFNKFNPMSMSGRYSDRGLDVAQLSDGTGWYVANTEAGEWIEYQDVFLGCGTYRFSARAAGIPLNGPSLLRLDIADLGTVAIDQDGGDVYKFYHLGQATIFSDGNFKLRVVFETGNVNLDWFFIKRIESC